MHPGRKTDLVDFLFLLGYSYLGGGLEIVKESFSLSPLSRLSCYEGNGLYKGSGCKLGSYEILGYRKTWNVKRGWERFATHVDPFGGFRMGRKNCDQKEECLNKYVQILTVEFAVDIGGGLRWGKAIVRVL